MENKSNRINWQIYDFYNMDNMYKRFIHTEMPSDIFRYVKDIINTRIGMFRYEGLPEGLTSQILEGSLFFNNSLCFAHIEGLGKWVLCSALYSSELDEYGKPIYVNLNTLTGISLAENVPYDDIIEVRDNSMNLIPFIPVAEFIEKIKKIEDDLFVLLDIGTLPAVITGNKKQVAELKQIASKLGKKDKAFITADNSLTDTVKTFNVNIPFNPLDVYELRNKYYNECMRSLGIYSVDAKRERIVTQELVNQNDFTDFIYQDARLERQLFIDKLNKKSGLNVKLIETYDVNYRDNINEKKDLAYEVTKAESKGELDGNPLEFKDKEVNKE